MIMALNNTNTNTKFVKLKDGKFYLGKDLETPYSELEGTITKAYYKDEEYEGSPLRKFIIVLSDDTGNYQLSLNVESSSYGNLISFLKNVDVNEVLTLHPKMETSNKDGKEFTKRSILVSQNGKFAKSYFTKENTHGLPVWNIVKIGNKKVIDKTDYLAFLEEFSMNDLFKNLGNIKKYVAPSKVAANKNDEEETAELVSNLPWDN
jgi:hypothetical protein